VNVDGCRYDDHMYISGTPRKGNRGKKVHSKKVLGKKSGTLYYLHNNT